MSPWTTMLKKDIRILSTGWLINLVILLVIVAAIGTATYFKFVPPGLGTMMGVLLIIANVIVLPAYLFKGLKKEMRGTASLWLHSPASGWTMLASKLVSSLIGAVAFLIISYGLTLALFHIDLNGVLTTGFGLTTSHSVTTAHGLTQTSRLNFSLGANGLNSLPPAQGKLIHALIGQLPLFLSYAAIGAFTAGLYISLWVALAYLAMCAARNRLHRFNWIAAVGVVLIGTWGVGLIKSTAVYQQLFGWGRIPLLSLIPANVQAALPVQPTPDVAFTAAGYIVFNIAIMAILFYLTGRIIDRHMEA